MPIPDRFLAQGIRVEHAVQEFIETCHQFNTVKPAEERDMPAGRKATSKSYLKIKRFSQASRADTHQADASVALADLENRSFGFPILLLLVPSQNVRNVRILQIDLVIVITKDAAPK